MNSCWRQTIIPIMLALVSWHCPARALDVVFRFDDYCLVEDSLQKELVETFSRNGVPITLAVVPFGQDDYVISSDTIGITRLNALLSEGLVEIAMHGYSHTRRTNGGEFGGVSADNQLYMLTSSYRVLDSLFVKPPVTFIPPWNNYDAATLNILEELGIKTISSCMTDGQSLDNPNLAYYPCTVGTYNAFVSFHKALEENKGRQGLLVFMFHAYDFGEQFTMNDLDALLEEVKGMEDVRCVTFRTLWEEGIVPDAERFKANLEVNLLTKLLGVNTIIQPTNAAVACRIINLLIYLFVASVLMFFPLLIMRKWRVLSDHSWTHFVAYLCVAIILFGCVWLHWWSPMKSLALAIVLSMATAFLLFFWSYRKATPDRSH